MTTIPAADSNFMTGAVLSWAIPITIVLVTLAWWATVLALRAFRSRR